MLVLILQIYVSLPSKGGDWGLRVVVEATRRRLLFSAGGPYQLRLAAADAVSSFLLHLADDLSPLRPWGGRGSSQKDVESLQQLAGNDFLHSARALSGLLRTGMARLLPPELWCCQPTEAPHFITPESTAKPVAAAGDIVPSTRPAPCVSIPWSAGRGALLAADTQLRQQQVQQVQQGSANIASETGALPLDSAAAAAAAAVNINGAAGTNVGGCPPCFGGWVWGEEGPGSILSEFICLGSLRMRRVEAFIADRMPAHLKQQLPALLPGSFLRMRWLERAVFAAHLWAIPSLYRLFGDLVALLEDQGPPSRETSPLQQQEQRLLQLQQGSPRFLLLAALWHHATQQARLHLHAKAQQAANQGGGASKKNPQLYFSAGKAVETAVIAVRAIKLQPLQRDPVEEFIVDVTASGAAANSSSSSTMGSSASQLPMRRIFAGLVERLKKHAPLHAALRLLLGDVDPASLRIALELLQGVGLRAGVAARGLAVLLQQLQPQLHAALDPSTSSNSHSSHISNGTYLTCLVVDSVWRLLRLLQSTSVAFLGPPGTSSLPAAFTAAELHR